MKTFLKQLYKNPLGNPFGYIPEVPKPNAAIYNRIFEIGGATSSFNWKSYLSERERQYWIPFCVAFSRLNCGEAKGNKEGVQINGSDRELGVISGTTMLGNSLEAVAEAFRIKGVRSEAQVPFTQEMLDSSGEDIWKKIFDLPADNGEFRYKGGNHSWVYGKAAMIDALNETTGSPLQIAVPLDGNWEIDGIVPKPTSIQAYHAVTLYHIDIDGFMYIQDSIGKEFKILTPDYPITGCKSFRDLPENWKEIMTKYFKVNDHGKLGIMILEGFTGTIIFENDFAEYQKLLEITGINDTTPTINIP